VQAVQDDYVSSRLAVELKELDDPDISGVSNAPFEMDVSLDGAFWETSEVLVRQDSVIVLGRLRLNQSAVKRLEDEPGILATLSYDLMPQHPMSSVVEPTGRVKLLVCNNWSEVDYLIHYDEAKATPKFSHAFFWN